jgi:hypothetical protein
MPVAVLAERELLHVRRPSALPPPVIVAIAQAPGPACPLAPWDKAPLATEHPITPVDDEHLGAELRPHLGHQPFQQARNQAGARPGFSCGPGCGFGLLQGHSRIPPSESQPASSSARRASAAVR